jgi:hypothetical protein
MSESERKLDEKRRIRRNKIGFITGGVISSCYMRGSKVRRVKLVVGEKV